MPSKEGFSPENPHMSAIVPGAVEAGDPMIDATTAETGVGPAVKQILEELDK